jgi:hypothetical protein
VRIFVHPSLAAELRGLTTLPAIVDETLRRMA